MDNLSDLYGYVRCLIADLAESNRSTFADQLSVALGGTTSGEILEGLWFALREVDAAGFDYLGIADAVAYIERTLGPPRSR
jgi:hypothetical protein